MTTTAQAVQAKAIELGKLTARRQRGPRIMVLAVRNMARIGRTSDGVLAYAYMAVSDSEAAAASLDR